MYAMKHYFEKIYYLILRCDNYHAKILNRKIEYNNNWGVFILYETEQENMSFGMKSVFDYRLYSDKNINQVCLEKSRSF